MLRIARDAGPRSSTEIGELHGRQVGREVESETCGPGLAGNGGFNYDED